MNVEGDFLCCVDNIDIDVSDESIFVKNMEEDSFYDDWFQANLKIIPQELGGKATPETNEKAYRTENYRTAQWVRKIAAMNYAFNNDIKKYSHFMWVDCDCFFTSKFTEGDLVSALNGKSFCYHLGRDRIAKGLGVETGLLGFKNDKSSEKILKRWIKKYTTGSFLNHDKWNDAHMFFYVLNENKKIADRHGEDLVRNYGNVGRARSHVIIRGSLGKFFDHNKGHHKRNI